MESNFDIHNKDSCFTVRCFQFFDYPLKTKVLRVRSFGRSRIWISDLWRSFRANPFSDQWSIKSTLDKNSSDH